MIGVFDHEMHIKRQLRLFADETDDRRAERNVVDEMAVHDVAMDPISPGCFDPLRFPRPGGNRARIEGATELAWSME